MGSGSFDVNAYRSYSHSVKSKPREEIFTSRGIDPSLDPKGVKLRESRDSSDSPKSTPILLALDVTGSMGVLAETIAKQGLGVLIQGILDRKPVTDPHIAFSAIGDAAHDQAPLQISQFEADNRIVEQLAKIWLEGGGGGNACESYDFPWYFAARHTAHDAMEKRGRRGYLFTVGDEEVPEGLTRDELERVLGYRPETDVPARQSLEEARRLYDVFHVIVEEGSHARQHLPRVNASWAAVLGQRVIHLTDHRLLAETVVSAISVAEGADHRAAVSGWGSSERSVVGRAIAELPIGKPPRRLGAGSAGGR